jgi:type IV pilus assembly protein PilV
MKKRAKGFTLVEALIALLALSIGLLGVAALQMTGLKANLSAAWRTQATYLAYDILDRMRANRTAIGSYATGFGALPSPGGVAQSDLTAWRANIAAALPGGTGAVAVNGQTVTVQIQWDDERTPGSPLTFQTVSQL